MCFSPKHNLDFFFLQIMKPVELQSITISVSKHETIISYKALTIR